MTVAVLGPDPEDEGPQPPQNLGSEAAMLSGVLTAGRTDTATAHALVDDLAVLVEPDDMWFAPHARVWASMIEAAALGEPLDAAAVASRIFGTGAPNARQAATATLPHLVTLDTPAGSATHHARKVAACAVRRRLIAAGTQLVQRATAETFDEGQDLPPVMTALEQAAGGHQSSTAVPVASVMEHALDQMENPDKIDVIPSGLLDLDLIYPGLRPGQLVVIGARPSIGKSALALTLAGEAAVRLKEPTLLCSAEMTRLEVTQRLIAARATVDLGKILAGTLDDREWGKVAAHVKAISEAPLLIDDASDLTVAHIRAQVRRQARRGLRLVIIDYLQLISMPRAESRQTGVDEVARQLKVLAGECNVPIVLLSQLNRGPEQRHDRRPMMSDLRESGGIENHADVVMLLHRPDFYDPNERAGEADILIPKHRNGRTGVAIVAFQGHYCRFVSMASWGNR